MINLIIAFEVHVSITISARLGYTSCMGRYIQQNQSRSELQQRIAADLRAKAASANNEGDAENPKKKNYDGVDDADYMKGTKSTTTLAPVWAIIFLLAVGVFIYFVMQANG